MQGTTAGAGGKDIGNQRVAVCGEVDAGVVQLVQGKLAELLRCKLLGVGGELVEARKRCGRLLSQVLSRQPARLVAAHGGSHDQAHCGYNNEGQHKTPHISFLPSFLDFCFFPIKLWVRHTSRV